MNWVDWIFVGIPILLVILAALKSQKYVKGVADFISAGRVAGRYVVSVASGESKELYFYTAPNFTADQTRATVLCIEGKEPVILSNGAPDTANRDYNLYHNSNYTFTINVN